MSNYPGYPSPFSTWDTFTSSIRTPFAVGGLHLPSLSPSTSHLPDPTFLVPPYRSPVIDPLQSLHTVSHLPRPVAYPRYLASDLPALRLEPLYGFGLQEPASLLLSPNLPFSQNPSPLTFDQIYRPGASSVSPVSQYRSHFDERALTSRLAVPGRFSEPLHRDHLLPSSSVQKSDQSANKRRYDANIEERKPKAVKLWKPFECDTEKEKQAKPKHQTFGSSFSIEALTSNVKTTIADTVDANANHVTKCSKEQLKSYPEKPIPKYPSWPVPIFNAGPRDNVTTLSSSANHFDIGLRKSDVTSKSASSPIVSNTSVVKDADVTDKLNSEKESIKHEKKPCVDINVSDDVTDAKSDVIDVSELVNDTHLAKNVDNASEVKKESENCQKECDSKSADETVPYIETKKETITKELQISLPKLVIEIPASVAECVDIKEHTDNSSKQAQICSPPANFKNPSSKLVSPSKGKSSKKNELLQLSIQVNEVRNRRNSKDTKLLSPTLASPTARCRTDSGPSDKLLSPPIQTSPKSKTKCSKTLEKRRLSLPIIGRSAGQVRYLARMSSVEGAITMLKNTEDSLSASISSSHLSESDSDTQLSTENAEKMFRESQSHNTRPSFSPAQSDDPAYMSNIRLDSMNHDNQYYKANTPQMCQNESDNQKPYTCVQGQMFREKDEALPSYNCYSSNQSPNILPRDTSFHSQEENSNFPPSLAANSAIDYDESSNQLPPRCDSQSSASHGSDGMPCKGVAMLQGSVNPSNQDSYTPQVQDESEWDFMHSKQYIDNIYGQQMGCEIVKSEAEALRESDSPKTFIDLDKTTKEKKAQESLKDRHKDGYGSKNYGKALMRHGFPPGHRPGASMYGTQSYDNYAHMAGNRWSSFNRNEGMMGNAPRPGGDYGNAYDHSHQFRNNYPSNYSNINQNQNGNQSGYHGNEFNQNDYYNQNPQVKNYQGNYGNGRFDNGFYQNRGSGDYPSQNNMYPNNPSEMQGPRFPGPGFTGAQGNYNQHYGQQAQGHCGPDNTAQYHNQESTGFNIPRNASPASTGSDFSAMEAPGGIPKKKRGRKRKVDKEPPDENKPRPNTIVMAPTKLGPLVDIDNPESTIDTYDYSNQIETIFNFNIEDDLSPIGAQYLHMEQRLCQKLLPIKYGYPVTVIYSPLTYAFQTHRDFVAKYCTSERTLLFLGMNPGPYGMSQNGVPFGEAIVTRDWLKISGDVYKPEIEHPKKPVTGLACTRNEVSGARFWGLFQKVCKVSENFFKNSFVYNFCPLAYMSESGKNVTPPQLVHSELDQINECCDAGLIEVVKLLNIRVIIAVGKFVQQRASKALHNAGIMNIKVECILHPSPINPHANKGWEQIVAKQLIEMNVMHYLNPDVQDVQRCIEEWERIAQSNVKAPTIMEKQPDF